MFSKALMVVSVWAFPWLALAVMLKGSEGRSDLSGLAVIQLVATGVILWI